MIGRRWVLVPVLWCEHCRQQLPVNHDCRAIRQLFVLAANTVHPSPCGLDRIREQTARRRPWWALWRSRTQKTAPEAPGAATNTTTHEGNQP